MLYKILMFIFSPLLWLIYRPEIIGKEYLKEVKDTGYILISNHSSYRDPVVLALMAQRRVYFMAKKELFHGLFGVLISSVGAFPISRNGSDTKAIRKAMDVVKNGDVCLIFPEGTRSKSNEILPFEKGVAFITMQCKVPVVPVYIEPGWRRGRVHMVIGKPIDVVVMGKEFDKRARLEEITNQLEQIMQELKQEEQALCH